ncbi:hypothetical protein PL9214290414 [Planktothrix tepida PCC 9214]|uniref:Uncharacterized protein n=1 Tax=Planktothrix tepida PCC 9214 TaxID=671072 RepID=A0A1J1LE03_9CYAN|nr:hypothetical protein PL9214290414 [Planktothrix tepida PCC 9214]
MRIETNEFLAIRIGLADNNPQQWGLRIETKIPTSRRVFNIG